ncbi:unnamed protein product [Staurois parvus]|uniref:Olfactory receptor n=1 Tax=Staurois parvus TaxID=386267 RepID=A0ABN9E2L6_9NEOB|nr:unnamed protein product [Staurois parvus]
MYTFSSELILRGLTDNLNLNVPLFLVFLFIYISSIVGNTGIIVTIWMDPALHTPMYFFVSQLAMLDLFYTSVITPNTLADINRKIKSISVIDCAIQFVLYGGSATTESYLLAVMAYDRFVAICQPLQYIMTMSKSICKYLVAAAYSAGYINVCIQACFTLRLNYLKDNIIDHFYCDILPIIKLTCSDTYLNEVVIFLFGGFASVICLSTILFSYINILVTILRIQSARGRSKAFSTCASHLTCLSIFYGTVMFTYLRPPSDYMLDNDKLHVNDKIISVFYAVVIPTINPLIYSLRNTEVKEAVRKIANKYNFFQIFKRSY